jgi:hypothetical protein
MIVVYLQGGIGNQLFQYAAGRRLAHTLGVPLKLDLSRLAGVAPDATPRRYALAPFRIRAEIATPEESAALSAPAPGLLRRLLSLVPPCSRQTHVRERWFSFDRSILELPDGVILDGYWQSERYFADIAPLLREELVLSAEPSEGSRAALRLIKGVNAVSIHVRRGDYVTDAKVAAKHGTCSDAYYREAVAAVVQRVENPRFFVFSDDPAWVRASFSIPYPTTVVDENGPDRPYEDLMLMSACRHHIIANSSFSWWGAWLGTGSDRIVVAPERWFREPGIDTRDLIPESWLKVDA